MPDSHDEIIETIYGQLRPYTPSWFESELQLEYYSESQFIRVNAPHDNNTICIYINRDKLTMEVFGIKSAGYTVNTQLADPYLIEKLVAGYQKATGILISEMGLKD